MDISNFKPPTDSLYKFIALSGLILIIIINLTYQFINYKLFIKNEEVWRDSIRINNKLQTLNNGIKNENKILNIHPNHSDSIKNLLQSDIDSINNAFQYENTEKTMYVHILQKYKKTVIYSLIISFFVMLHGFILWYFKIQRFQDIILKNEAIRNSNQKDIEYTKYEMILVIILIVLIILVALSIILTII